MDTLRRLGQQARLHALVVIIALSCLGLGLVATPVLGQSIASPTMSVATNEPTTFPELASAAQAGQEQARLRPEEAFVRTELFFGSQRSGQPDVSEAEFRTFLAQVVTPRFPDGLTLLIGDGQFRNARGDIIRERSFVLILLYPVGEKRAKSGLIEEIRQLYKQAFQQESVLRVDDLLPVRVTF